MFNAMKRTWWKGYSRTRDNEPMQIAGVVLPSAGRFISPKPSYMKKTLPILTLIAVLTGLTGSANAQLVVWAQNFDFETTGPYGAHTTDFINDTNYPANPQNNIIFPGAGGSGQAMQLTFNCTNGIVVNLQTATLEYPAADNTNALLSNYTLDFDMAIDGGTPGFGMEIGVFGTGSWIFYGDAIKYELGAASLPAPGTGFQHFSINLGAFSPSGDFGTNFLHPTDSSFSVGFGVLAYPSGTYGTPEAITVDNITITMNTNPPPIPRPTLHMLPTTPGLRVFAQNYNATYNQEGFGTVDSGQSWVGAATPGKPVRYSLAFADFDTVDNFTLYSQFVPNVASINPFVVYAGSNALTWSITHVATGFTTTVAWKTNSPNSGNLPNVALALTTTSTNGRGIWTLTFTNDTGGTVSAPDGTSGAFSLPPDMVALFANPLTILFGEAPNNTQGYGQYFDLSRITITNVAGVNEDDDFTKDISLNTNLWNTAFSLDPGSVFQVSTNTPYWLYWNVPDTGFGLATTASLNAGNNTWFSPAYYGSGVGIAPTGPGQMGPTNKWVLIPSACLPTVDGTTNGPVSSTGFFRLQNPPPSQ